MYVYAIQKTLFKMIIILIPLKKRLKCLFMFMLYSKIKIEIDTKNYELLENIWEHMKEIKRGRGYY
jgi:hypothetical protein